MDRPHIGILLNHRTYLGILSGRTGHEALKQYVIAGQRYEVDPCFFEIRGVDFKRGKVRAYMYNGTRFIHRELPLPAIIHNRAMYRSASANAKLDRLANRGILVFNQRNRYGKLYIYKLLMKNESIRVHLPHTAPATKQNIARMMKGFSALMIKPNNGSIGQGIMLLERDDSGYWRLKRRLGSRKTVISTLMSGSRQVRNVWKRVAGRGYLVQQRLPLALYEGRPFDVRVSVQKGDTGDWQVTGMVGKAAASRSYLTNVAQGGDVHTIERLTSAYSSLDTDALHARIGDFSLRVAEILGGTLPMLADIGLDIGITDDGFPMFIECNGRDLRYSFKYGGLDDVWANTYANPIGYAAWLLRHKVQPG